MTNRGFFLALIVYLTLDFANPLMPGAVNFDSDESVEGVTLHHPRSKPLRSHVVGAPLSLSVTAVPAVAPQARAERPRSPVPGDWLARVRLAHAGQSEPPPPTDDH